MFTCTHIHVCAEIIRKWKNEDLVILHNLIRNGKGRDRDFSPKRSFSVSRWLRTYLYTYTSTTRDTNLHTCVSFSCLEGIHCVEGSEDGEGSREVFGRNGMTKRLRSVAQCHVTSSGRVRRSCGYETQTYGILTNKNFWFCIIVKKVFQKCDL